MFEHDLFIKNTKEEGNVGEFSIEPLTAGFGNTIGNSLRRVLLSSLEGAAVDSVKIDGVEHEFDTIEGVKEDVVEIILNLKQLRFELKTDEATITLNKKGKGVVTAADFDKNTECVPTNTDHHIATISGNTALSMELKVKKGRGYEAVETKETKSNPIGVISMDSIFSPILAASYKVEHTRVGQETNLDKVVLHIETDGSITPKDALAECCQILTDHFTRIGGLPEQTIEPIEMEVIKEESAAEKSTEPLHPKMKIEEAGFSSRTTNALLTAGYKTISGLVRLSDIKLESIKGLGAKGLAEVKEALTRVTDK